MLIEVGRFSVHPARRVELLPLPAAQVLVLPADAPVGTGP